MAGLREREKTLLSHVRHAGSPPAAQGAGVTLPYATLIVLRVHVGPRTQGFGAPLPRSDYSGGRPFVSAGPGQPRAAGRPSFGHSGPRTPRTVSLAAVTSDRPRTLRHNPTSGGPGWLSLAHKHCTLRSQRAQGTRGARAPGLAPSRSGVGAVPPPLAGSGPGAGVESRASGLDTMRGYLRSLSVASRRLHS